MLCAHYLPGLPDANRHRRGREGSADHDLRRRSLRGRSGRAGGLEGLPGSGRWEGCGGGAEAASEQSTGNS
eukprot:12507080-Alexandrium_andersonii.AAC.1